jgi:hypothetical protein
MAILLTQDGKIFRPYKYERESEFEADVVRLADQLFGAGSIYVDVKKRMGSDVVTIPDGYLIDTTDVGNPELFVVENEIVGHDPFKHIGIQMLKFVTSFDEAQRSLRTFLMKEIRANSVSLKRLEDACHKSHGSNIDEYLDRAVYKTFSGLVVIDEARPELHRVLEKINANISVLELKTYVSDGGAKIYNFDTLYDEFEEDDSYTPITGTATTQAQGRIARRERRAGSDTVVVPAREEGFEDVFLGENRWYAIRIGAAMKERLKYIAAYRVAPRSAVTHIAEIASIKPYKDSGKYVVNFKAPAQEIGPIRLGDGSAPQAPVYVRRDRLLQASSLADAMEGS